MANADMKRLMDHAKIRLPGSLDSALQMELFSVLNEFFQTSNIWYEDVAFPVTPTADTYLQNPDAFTYEIIPDQGAITRLMGVVDSQGRLQAASMPVLGDLILGYSPNVADTYTARVALTVTDPVTREGYPEFPDWVLNKYGNEILDGLLGHMMSQIAKPYTSPTIAMVHLRKFNSGVSKAKVEASHQNVYRGQSWRFPQAYASRRTMKF
jgi:hypothetical protein